MHGTAGQIEPVLPEIGLKIVIYALQFFLLRFLLLGLIWWIMVATSRVNAGSLNHQTNHNSHTTKEVCTDKTNLLLLNS